MPDQAGREATACEPCGGTGLFRVKNEPPDDCMTCGGTGWVGQEATPREDGAEVLAEHIATCRPDIEATIVMHKGSADETVAELLSAGWTWGAPTEHVAGKRLRTLVAPQTAPARETTGGDA